MLMQTQRDAGFGLAAAAWAAVTAVFVTECCGRFTPHHSWLRRFPLVLMLAAELAKFRYRHRMSQLASLACPACMLLGRHHAAAATGCVCVCLCLGASSAAASAAQRFEERRSQMQHA